MVVEFPPLHVLVFLVMEMFLYSQGHCELKEGSLDHVIPGLEAIVSHLWELARVSRPIGFVSCVCYLFTILFVEFQKHLFFKYNFYFT